MNTDTSDPRITGEHLRRLSGSDGVGDEGAGESNVGDVTLVGVVHDHPASKHRVGTTVEAVDPDVLALELPPLAIPLYEGYADDPRSPPRFGGEMSAAVAASDGDRIVGIDGPSAGFAARLFRKLAGDSASIDALRSVVRSLATGTKRAVACRFAAGLAAWTGLTVEVGDPTAHGCDRSDDPATQAEDERSRVRRARTIAETFERPETDRVRTVTREAHMADRLAALRREGDVVAVVGIAHLDPLVARLTDGASR